jgi:NTP pyrophosphatase (non-canonical NTP hydrolase)
MNSNSDYIPVRELEVLAIDNLCNTINDWAEKKGWNEEKDSVDRKLAEMMLMTTEIAEAAEGVRSKVTMMDDKIPDFSSEEAELADLMIRVFHYCGRRGLRLGLAIQQKHLYNISRPYRHNKLA